MSKVVVAAAVSVLAFVLGITGAYLAMPSMAPEMVENTHRILDSLVLADSSFSFAEVDSLIRADTVAQAAAEPEAPEPVVPPALITSMKDSLTMLREQLNTSTEELRTLREQVRTIQRKWEELERRRQEASQLSGTLTKLEDRELSAVLEQLDLSVLEMLYIEASGRNRARLLQAMPAARAALVVRGLVNPSSSSVPPSPPDTVASDPVLPAPNEAALSTLN